MVLELGVVRAVRRLLKDEIIVMVPCSLMIVRLLGLVDTLGVLGVVAGKLRRDCGTTSDTVVICRGCSGVCRKGGDLVSVRLGVIDGTQTFSLLCSGLYEGVQGRK